MKDKFIGLAQEFYESQYDWRPMEGVRSVRDVFGLIIALSGCYQGMQVHGNSEEVGQRTTKAVVQAIFTVIVLDAFFAVFFTKIGWG